MIPAVRVFRILKEKVEAKGEIIPARNQAWWWYTKHATMLRNWQRNEESFHPTFQKIDRWKFAHQIVPVSRPHIGKMFMFVYDPKWQKVLPYYDTLPLVIPFSWDLESMTGLNLHYLSYDLRARLFDALAHLTVSTRNDFQAYMKLSYRLLKSTALLRAYRPCVKKYLYTHVRSRGFLQIGQQDWTVAMFLPAEQFVKASKQQVWKDSRRTIMMPK